MRNNFLQMLRSDGERITIALLAVALLLVLGSNFLDLRTSQKNLEAAIEQQDTTIKNNAKIEQQLERLASGTKRLSNQGNPNAQKIIALLKQNGININTK